MKLSLDFAFEGFRIVRQRPTVLLFWGLLSLIFGGIAMYLTISAGGPSLQDILNAVNTKDTAAIVAVQTKFISVTLLSVPFSLIMQALVSNAIFRQVLSGKAGRFGGLGLGKDELRQIVVVVLFQVMTSLLLVACLAVASLIGAALMAVLGQGGIALALMLGTGVFLWLVARLSLAPVQSFDQKRINLLGSWELTKGQTSKLLIGYVIALILSVVVYFLCVAILAMCVVAFNGGNVSALNPLQDITGQGAKAFENPVVVTFAVAMNFLVAPLLLAISIGAPAAAYKTLSGKVASAETVF